MTKNFVAISLIFFLLTMFTHHQSFATAYPVPVDIIPNKPFYTPGENVTLTINVPYIEGMTIELSATEGHTEESIFQTTKPLDGNSTIIEFTLPKTDIFYQYPVYATVTSPNPNEDGSASVMIFTKEGADKVLISDLNIEKSQVSTGGSILISFKVKDGTGNVISWANPDIGICKENAVKPHYVTVTPNSTLTKDSDCLLYQSDFTTTSDEYNIDLVVPQDMPEGKYKLNIWANPDYTGEYGFVMGHEVLDIVIGKANDQMAVIKSPLKQFQSGVVLGDIKCREGLQLVVKFDNSPACVKPETMQKLIECGWAKPV